jgi:hypothetical protein
MKPLSGVAWEGSCTKNPQLPGCSSRMTLCPSLVRKGQLPKRGESFRSGEITHDETAHGESRTDPFRVCRPGDGRGSRGTARARVGDSASPARRVADVCRTLRLLGLRPFASGGGAAAGLCDRRRRRACALRSLPVEPRGAARQAASHGTRATGRTSAQDQSRSLGKSDQASLGGATCMAHRMPPL